MDNKMGESQLDSKKVTRRTRSVLELSCDDARAFFLKQESYCTIDLPKYFQFNTILSKVEQVLCDIKQQDLPLKEARKKEGVNHLLLTNKDGRYGWRPLQLIHPALYVSLVNKITGKDQWEFIINRFKDFVMCENIQCMSLPVQSLTEEKNKAEQITKWWRKIQQASIEQALDYEFLTHTDLIDCYSSIYTHSIPWALHNKDVAKRKRHDDTLIGNVIDKHIQAMQYGQTNGIPQGSVLMDFLAEMVLGYADSKIAEKIENQRNLERYHILRYRDDYRIFTHNSQDSEIILKCITEVMIELGLKISPAKTQISNQIIRNSIKEDKYDWICKHKKDNNIQKQLIIIYNHAIEYPNSGSLIDPLNDYYKRISRLKKYNEVMPLISIVVDIAYRNPRTYLISAAIISKLLNFLGEQEKKPIIKRIRDKFSQIPNVGHMEIWLQRITHPIDKEDKEILYNEPLCRLIQGLDSQLWESEWITSDNVKKALDLRSIIDWKSLAELNPIIDPEEIELFVSKAEYADY